MSFLSSLKYRIAITIFFTGFILLLLVLFTTLAHIGEEGRKQLDSIAETGLSMLVEAGRTALLISDYTDLQPYVEKTFRTTGLARIEIANEKGVIVASSIPLNVGKLISQLSKGPHWKNRDIVNATGKIGSVHVRLSYGEINTLIEKSRRRGILYGLAGMSGIALLSILMGGLLTRRLRALEDLTRKYAQGDFSIIRHHKGGDEISSLGNSINHMVENIKGSIEKLEKSEDRFELSVKGSSDGLWDWDVGNREIWYSDRFKELLGYIEDEFPNKLASFNNSLHPDDHEKVWQAIHAHLEERREYDIEFRLRHRDGDYRWFRARGQAVWDENNRPARMAGSIQDIHKRKQSELALIQSEETLRLRDRCLQNAENGILIAAARREDNPVIYCNQGFTRLTGYTMEEVLGRNCRLLQGKNTDRTTVHNIKEAIEQGTPVQATILNYRKDGSTFWNKLSITPVRDKNGTLDYFIGVLTDITENVNLSLKLNYQASHDSLTQLINRREFEYRLKRLLLQKRLDQSGHVLCYFDLDQFKIINDTCGHVVGDRLLRDLSDLMQSAIRQRDTLARLGGDEFALLMEHCSLEDGMRVAEKLKQAIGEFEFKWGATSFRIGVSMGLVAIAADDDDFAEILKKADSACYIAKELGRNRIHIYSDHDSDLNDRQDQMRWVIRIHNAIEQDRFRLFLQPIVPVSGTSHRGRYYEALLRLNDDQGLILPEDFLPAAERYQLSKNIDYWVVEHILEYMSRYPAWYDDLFMCSINLSGLSLGDAEFMQHIDTMFEKTSVPPDKICFEITESAAVRNFPRACDFITRLKSRGCRFALDDFGKGVSSFAYLKNLPVDYLKIDGEFIRDINKNNISRVMVKSISEISRVMGKRTVAEFVENGSILEQLRHFGIDYAQGYYLGKPRPLNEVMDEFISDQEKRSLSEVNAV